MLGDNKYFIIMYKNKETVSRSATNSEDNHAAILSCKKPQKKIQFRARTDTEPLLKLLQSQFSQTQTGVFFKILGTRHSEQSLISQNETYIESKWGN